MTQTVITKLFIIVLLSFKYTSVKKTSVSSCLDTFNSRGYRIMSR